QASAGDEKAELSFFTQKQFNQLQQIIDTILPKTDSPSATEVGVDKIIDHMLGNAYPQEARTSYEKGFAALSQHLAKQDDLLGALQELENNTGEDQALREAYLHLKQQSIAYYLSTEQIGKNYLNYLPVPGEYQACISLEEAGNKAWTL
ncbi:MAG: gluconate 2-dehydrogenase subunit 3 family protein, partial [Bacteroidota bacterium]